MDHGLPTTTVEKIHGVLARYPAIERAVLYGSRAKGNYKPGSDIDLTLLGSGLTHRMLADIADALDDLLLPYGIDLSLFAEIDNESLREHIGRVGVMFYERANPASDSIEETPRTEAGKADSFNELLDRTSGMGDGHDGLGCQTAMRTEWSDECKTR